MFHGKTVDEKKFDALNLIPAPTSFYVNGNSTQRITSFRDDNP